MAPRKGAQPVAASDAGNIAGKSAKEAAAKPKRPMGRPTDYTVEKADEICRRLIQGETITGICRDAHMPEVTVMFDWRERHPYFAKAYARARTLQMEVMEASLYEISDDSEADEKERVLPSGKVIVVPDHENVARSKLRVDTRKWVMARMAATKYGDHLSTRPEAPETSENDGVKIDGGLPDE